jgi:hypothetical protein
MAAWQKCARACSWWRSTWARATSASSSGACAVLSNSRQGHKAEPTSNVSQTQLKFCSCGAAGAGRCHDLHQLFRPCCVTGRHMHVSSCLYAALRLDLNVLLHNTLINFVPDVFKLCREQMRCRLKNLYSMKTALRWAAEAASALAALHEQQPPYIHGDVKADNVFLTDARNVERAVAKLGDLKAHRCAACRHGPAGTQSLSMQWAATAAVGMLLSEVAIELNKRGVCRTYSCSSGRHCMHLLLELLACKHITSPLLLPCVTPARVCAGMCMTASPPCCPSTRRMWQPSR